jgi:tRNA(adenine34) deaminase
MQRALEQAWTASVVGEVPVGAVLVWQDRLLAEAHNLTRTTGDPTAHAELVALRRGAERAGSAVLPGCTLYVTLEPCASARGMVLARVARLVYAAADPKSGCVARSATWCRIAGSIPAGGLDRCSPVLPATASFFRPAGDTARVDDRGAVYLRPPTSPADACLNRNASC